MKPTLVILFAVILWMSVCDWTPEAPLTHTRNQMVGLETALEAFKVDCGRYPTTAEGLNALLVVPAAVHNWHGPFADEQLITDLWKHHFVYRCPGIHNTNGFDLYSCGLDGVSKTGGSDPDDFNNWDPSSPHAGDYFNHFGHPLRNLILCGVGFLAIIYLVSRKPRRNEAT